MNTIKTVSAIALLGLTLNVNAQEPVVTAFALGGPATAKLDGYQGAEAEEKTTLFGATVSVQLPTEVEGMSFRLDPTIQYGKVSTSEEYYGYDLNMDASMWIIGLPVGLDYAFNKNLTGFVTAGPALGVMNVEVEACGYYNCASVSDSESDFGVMGVAGVEYRNGNFAMRAHYQVAKVNDVTVTAPMIGLGYKF